MNPELRMAMSHLFGLSRAEEQPSSYTTLFVRPPYQDLLEEQRNVVLAGLRGSGKTTALRHLAEDPGDRGYVAIYHRVNKNQSLMFAGIDDVLVRRRAFAHYANLFIAHACLRLLCHRGAGEYGDTAELDLIASSLCVPQASTPSRLIENIEKAIIELENFVNNPKHLHSPQLGFSIAESPVKRISRFTLDALGTRAHVLFICIDEYENLLAPEIQVFNTYIKHAEKPISYKIGVRGRGMPDIRTVTENDPLNDPADLRTVQITESILDDSEFLTNVVDRRLQELNVKGFVPRVQVGEMLEQLSAREEAIRLGADSVAREVRAEIERSGLTLDRVSNLPDGDLYFVKYRAESRGISILEAATEWQADPTKCAIRLGNYRIPSIFWLSKGRKGLRMRKYYAGWDTFELLAAGNTRFMLRLIEASLSRGLTGKTDPWPISSKDQTNAARSVARNHLMQLDDGGAGGSVYRLLMVIGKALSELTRDPINRTPEPAEFELSGPKEDVEKVSALLREGVRILAFEQNIKNKLTAPTQVQEFVFRIHPILAPFFWISYTRKRRITLSATLLASANDDTEKSLGSILRSVGCLSPEPGPAQRGLFDDLFVEADLG